MKISYFITKAKQAYEYGNLFFKLKLFIKNLFARYIFSIYGSLLLSKQEKNFDLVNGFQDHRLEQKNSIKLDNIKRIIKFYKHSKSLQDHAEKQFRIRGNWDDWLKANYGKLISALNNEEVDNLKKIFSNIFREPLTIGTLSGFDGYLRHKSFFGKLYTQTIWNKYYNLLKEFKKITDCQF